MSSPRSCSRKVLDVAIPLEDVGLLTMLVAGMVAIPIVTCVLGVWQTLLLSKVGQCSRAPSSRVSWLADVDRFSSSQP